MQNDIFQFCGQNIIAPFDKAIMIEIVNDMIHDMQYSIVPFYAIVILSDFN